MSNPVPKIAAWEDMVLRLIAFYKFTKASLALALGLALLHLIHRDLSAFLHDYIIGPLHFNIDNPDNAEGDSENRFVQWLFKEAASMTPHAMRMSAYACFFYATVFALEGTGLFLKKHWGEYMVIVVTGSFLPFEAMLIYNHIVWWKILLVVGNLLIIGYLVHRLWIDHRYKKAMRQAAEDQAKVDEREKARSVSAPRPAASEVP